MKSSSESVEELVTIATFPNSPEASIAQGALAEAGVAAYLAGEGIATTLSHLGPVVAGVKLQVSREDAQRAAELLQQLHESEQSPSIPAWVCPGCEAEVDAGFEVCWSCGKPADFDEIQTESPSAANVEYQIESQPTTDDSQQREMAGDETARRAWRTAVLGIVFPPLLIYTMYLAVVASGKELSPKGKRDFCGAMILTVVMIVGYWMLFRPA